MLIQRIFEGTQQARKYFKCFRTAFKIIEKQYTVAASPVKYDYVNLESIGANKNVGLIQLHRPKFRNAFNDMMITELAKAIQYYDANESINVIIITGTGNTFCAGGDLKELSAVTFPGMIKTGFYNAWETIHDCEKPIISAVNGLTIGGGFELILLTDIVYASETATFIMAEVANGIICGGGGTQRLARIAGKSNALEIILTASPYSAKEGEKIGFINKVVAKDKLMEVTKNLAEKIASQPSAAVRKAKQAINMSFDTTLRAGLKYERLLNTTNLA